MEDFETALDRLLAVGEQLVPYNSDTKLENDIHMLKTVEVMVDGYEFELYFHKLAYEGNFLELVQLSPSRTIFLPFNVVVKVARKALGGHHLSFVQYFDRNGSHRIYCWSVYRDQRGRPLPYPFSKKNSEHRVFDGVEYDQLDPKELNIY